MIKVAVISNQETQQGRSVFILTLASLFARSQQRRVSILSTGEMSNMLSQCEVKIERNAGNSVAVYKALVETRSLKEDELYDYAVRLGEEEVYAFDLFSAALDEKALEELFRITVGGVNSDLVLIEVKGDLDSEFNKEVMADSDLILNVFNATPSSLKVVTAYYNSLSVEKKSRIGFVCQKYCADVISEKKLSTVIGVSRSNLMVLPESTVIADMCVEGQVNQLSHLIVKGVSAVIELRAPLLRIMQYIFNTQKFRRIKEVSEWSD